MRAHKPLSYCCPATIFRDILAALFGRMGETRAELPFIGDQVADPIHGGFYQALATGI
jgi:hypothetical protein